MRFATVFFLLTVFGFKGFSQMSVNPADSIFADLEKDFVFVEGGTFMSTSATTNPESHKIHKEKVSDFYIARYEVTVGLYEKVTGKNPTSSRDKDRPVENISGYDCVDFCNAGKNPAYVGRGDCWIFGK